MDKYFFLDESNSHIIHPITLSFSEEKLSKLYFDSIFSYKTNIIFSSIELFFSIIVIIISIISYVNSKSTVNNLRLFMGILILIFLMINLVFFLLVKNIQLFRTSLMNFSICVQVASYKILFYLFLSLLYTEYYKNYKDIAPIISLIEMFLALSFMIFIDDNFVFHILTHITTCILIFIVETFLIELCQFSFIFLCSFCSSILICVFCYLHQRYKKIEWLSHYKKLTDLEYYSKLFVNNTFVMATFSRKEILNFNPTIRYLLLNSKLKEEIDKIILEEPESKLKSENNLNSKYINELSSITKKLIFSKIKIKNENLSSVIKEQINNIPSDENNFIERIDTFFSILRDKKEIFKKIYYLGEINFDNVNRPYSVFINVNSLNDNINYLAIGLDFPVEASQNLDLLGKISILSSKITHEIKNPLAAVETLVSEIKTFIENTGINEVINKLDAIYDYSEYMKYITKDFEFFALKLNNISEENNVTEVDIKRVNFYVIVNFAVELIKHIWKNKNSRVLIKKEIEKDIPEYINTDEIRVKQIIINLLSNSLKFTKMGSVTLICENYDNDFISIMVKDTGIGIKEEQVEKLNQDGTMFLKSNENNKFGSGLGLSIVKDMVKILGKNFKVESKYNEGTRISFLLNKNINSGDQEIEIMNNNNNNNNNKNIKNTSANRKEKEKDNLNSSTAALTGNTNNNNIEQINYKNKRISLFTHKEENTKREEYILMKPQDIASIPNGLKDVQSNYLNLPRKSMNINSLNKRSGPFNLINKGRMSVMVKPQTLYLPNIPIQDNFEEFSESNRNGRKKIYALVVEDEQVLRNCNVNIITKYFQERGVDISIDESNDGIECIYKIYKGFTKDKKYQFIVTDEQMNTMNGTMMTNIIRALIEEKRFYPIKIYSSSGNNIVDDNFKKNYEGVFSKPLIIENVGEIFKDNVVDNVPIAQ
jgi:signal transduction histidine kinase/CheY-like chemotaxis protein